jgi:hypothetical protein
VWRPRARALVLLYEGLRVARLVPAGGGPDLLPAALGGVRLPAQRVAGGGGGRAVEGAGGGAAVGVGPLQRLCSSLRGRLLLLLRLMLASSRQAALWRGRWLFASSWAAWACRLGRLLLLLLLLLLGRSGTAALVLHRACSAAADLRAAARCP